MAETFNDKVQVLKNDVFLYAKGEELSIDELRWLINRNEKIAKENYDKLMAYYVGKHDILDKPNKV
ncbi:MAG: phage portal protein, partial [Lactobacillus sp.]|nr:phage portal protein [Lactobacillus sp.]